MSTPVCPSPARWCNAITQFCGTRGENDEVWKLLHRHADPLMAITAPAAVLQPSPA
ncbi:MAG: hypothetical protein R3E79_23095 [Caldilineaceae bacterium]